ncbi:MAG: hypothetical protein KDB14_22805 [Planctomycetales bacterium]|nr:hypothetical protein [Planctomycetales bacterium]
MPLPLEHDRIDRIVQEVLRRLAATDVRHCATAPTPTPAPAAKSAAGVLSLADAVVTLQSLERRLEGVSELRVVPKAVVTPSVIDLLRERGVKLRRVSDAPTARCSLWLAVDGGLPAAWKVTWNSQRDAEHAPSGDPDAMLAWLANQLATGGLAVVASHRSLLLAAVANRRSVGRAAAIRHTDDVDAARRQLGANLLVVDTAATSATLERALRTRQAAPQPPQCALTSCLDTTNEGGPA